MSLLEKSFKVLEGLRRLLEGKKVDAVLRMVEKLLADHPYAEKNRRLGFLFIKNTLIFQLESELHGEEEKNKALEELYNELEERFKWEIPEETLKEMMRIFTQGEERQEP